jgi:hypothetical protein
MSLMSLFSVSFLQEIEKTKIKTIAIIKVFVFIRVGANEKLFLLSNITKNSVVNFI